MVTSRGDHLRQIPEESPVDGHPAAQLRAVSFFPSPSSPRPPRLLGVRINKPVVEAGATLRARGTQPGVNSSTGFATGESPQCQGAARSRFSRGGHNRHPHSHSPTRNRIRQHIFRAAFPDLIIWKSGLAKTIVLRRASVSLAQANRRLNAPGITFVPIGVIRGCLSKRHPCRLQCGLARLGNSHSRNRNKSNRRERREFESSLISLSATSASSAVRLLRSPGSHHPRSSIFHPRFSAPSIKRPIFNFDKIDSAQLFQIENTGNNRTHLSGKNMAFRERTTRFPQKFRASRLDFSLRASHISDEHLKIHQSFPSE